MRNRWVKRAAAWLLPGAAGLLLAWWGYGMSGRAQGESPLRQASDGLFVAGVVLTGIGLLTWISTTGFFDIFGYSVKILWAHISTILRPYDHVRYYDYKAQRAETRGKTRYPVLVTGAVFLLLSAGFLVLYHRGGA